jgi:hypothetical protein
MLSISSGQWLQAALDPEAAAQRRMRRTEKKNAAQKRKAGVARMRRETGMAQRSVSGGRGSKRRRRSEQ